MNTRILMKVKALAIIAFLAWSSSINAAAQPWSGIIDPARAIDWSQAGVTGGIPTRTVIYQTLSPGVTAAQINTALANCPDGRVVKLSAGTYNLSSGITFDGRSNVTLRGAGPDATFLVFTGDDACLGQHTTVCIGANDLGYYGPGSPTHTANWTAGYAQGATVITLSSTTGLSVGMFIVLDQLDNTSNPGTDIFVSSSSSFTDEGGGGYGRPSRQQRQMVRVTAINGSSVSISPGLHMPNWTASKSPGAYWGNSGSLSHGNGVEDLSIDGKNSGAATLVEMIYTYDSWAKNVRGVWGPAPRAYVALYGSAHCTVRDCYFFGSTDELSMGGSQHYGVDVTNGFDHLIENNIIQHRTTPFIANGGSGTVWGYNFAINDYYPISPAWMQASNYSHEAGNGMILEEGNQAVGIKGDIIHGTSNLFTFFRNYSIGWETGKDAETDPVMCYSYNRYWNFVGNVLGQPGYHTTYQGTGGSKTIWGLGIPGNTVPADPVVAATTMRWGNYDVVSGAAKWVASEVPSAIAKYPNPVPASQILPASFYLASKPAWYGNNGWPSIGPDVNGGTGPGNHVRRIPARVCFEDVMHGMAGDSTPRTFNADLCYGSGTAAEISMPETVWSQGPVLVTIYDIKGQAVKSLKGGYAIRGGFFGFNRAGRDLPGGIYLWVFRQGAASQVMKVAVIR